MLVCWNPLVTRIIWFRWPCFFHHTATLNLLVGQMACRTRHSWCSCVPKTSSNLAANIVEKGSHSRAGVAHLHLRFLEYLHFRYLECLHFRSVEYLHFRSLEHLHSTLMLPVELSLSNATIEYCLLRCSKPFLFKQTLTLSWRSWSLHLATSVSLQAVLVSNVTLGPV